jgi:hypothetical protein
LTHFDGNEWFQALLKLFFHWNRSGPEGAIHWFLQQRPRWGQDIR